MRIFYILLGLGLVVGGIVLGAQVVPTAVGVQRLALWTRVPAELVDVTARCPDIPDDFDDDEDTVHVCRHTALYRYVYGGKTYEGHAVSPDDGRVLSDWGHGEEALRLRMAMANKSPVDIYIDPSNPASASLTRRIDAWAFFMPAAWATALLVAGLLMVGSYASAPLLTGWPAISALVVFSIGVDATLVPGAHLGRIVLLALVNLVTLGIARFWARSLRRRVAASRASAAPRDQADAA
jgi:hypothetical protein